MTGFGRAEVEILPFGRAVVEIRTLNHRYREIECRLNSGLESFEEPIRKMLGESIRRGQVRILVVFAAQRGKSAALIDEKMARAYCAQLHELKRRLKLKESVSLETILRLPQVVAAPERLIFPEKSWPALKKGIAQALSRVLRMREAEGRRLGRELFSLVEKMESLHREIRRHLPAISQGFEKRLRERIGTLIPSLDPKVLAREAVLLVQASDVSEEVQRLGSHLAALRAVLLGAGENPGRTVEFLSQELLREVNTLGTKVRENSILHRVVAMKNQIEKIREQAANLE